MGTLIGHVLPGFAFFLMGFWHLFNHIKLYAQNPNSYKSSAWFPISKLRHLELFFVIFAGSISVSMELFVAPVRHQPLDPDGTIPTTHLHNFEHSLISMSLVVYSFFAILLDRLGPKLDQCNLSQFIAAVAFGQELLLFRLHSTDHTGVEGQYHLMLQILITLCLATTLMGIGYPSNFLISFVRSVCILAQGLWLILLGYLVWTPALVPKGCFLHVKDDHQVLDCSNEEVLHRAKSLVNILFSWFVIVITIFSVSFYLALFKIYGECAEYTSLAKDVGELEEEYGINVDDEPQGKNKPSKFMGKSGFASFNMER